MAVYARTPGSRLDVDWRGLERDLFGRVFAHDFNEALRRPGDIASAIPTSALNLTAATGPLRERWPTVTQKLEGRCPPSAAWSELIKHEPALLPYAFGGNPSRARLIARCEIILECRSIWSTALGLSDDATEYTVGVVLDILALISAAKDNRDRTHSRDGLSDWRYDWTDLGFCDLCWRLVPPSPQTGFHGHNDRGAGARARDGANSPARAFRYRRPSALCAEHRPSLSAETKARWKSDQTLRRVILRQPDEIRPTWFGVMPETIAATAQDPKAWGRLMTSAFPLTARAHPLTTCSLADAMHCLSGLPAHAVRALLGSVQHEESLAGCTVIAMLSTSEKILLHHSRTKRSARRKPRLKRERQAA